MIGIVLSSICLIPLLVMAIAMALGIGVNTTVFTLANAVLFRGLPFERADRVMHLTTTDLAKNRSAMHVSYPDFQDWRAQASTFQSLAAFSDVDAVITDSAAPPEQNLNNEAGVE